MPVCESVCVCAGVGREGRREGERLRLRLFLAMQVFGK